MIQLSVIIPVYNVEKYISKCIESVFCQGINESTFELIIVNDGTKDKSMELISKIIQWHTNVIVINQENKGLSAARNIGLARALGQYVLFVDSDDFLVGNTLKPLLDVAINSSVDMVMGKFIKLSENQVKSYTPISALKSEIEPRVMLGEEAFVNYLNPRECYVWCTLYRRDFLLDNHIKFLPGIYFEDIPFTVECYLKAEKCISLPISFYVYIQHSNSIVSSINAKKIFDFNIVIEYLWYLKNSLSLSNSQLIKLQDLIFCTLSIELWYLTKDKELYRYRREIVVDLKKRVPEMYFSNGFKQIVFSFLFEYMPFTYLWLRSFKLHKVFQINLSIFP
ncbi:MAG: glycosyltransferase [Prevotella sp.]|nr:glycosyltransferase [Prevotella sp.]